ncbi:MAG: serine/threonine-protein kinase [Kofleriaceae bacterium]
MSAAGGPPDDEDDPLVREQAMLGEYRVERVLGRGGMGVVYGARHPIIGKRVAIKVLGRETLAFPQATERFVREAQAVCAIGHPHIVDIFGFGTLPDGRAYYVMEWLSGHSLRDRLDGGPPIPAAEAYEIIDGIALALEAAHRQGVIHRDLKPDNVYLVDGEAGQPRVKLLDFGIAKLSGRASDGSQTATGMVIGTPDYMSPEQDQRRRGRCAG